MAHPLLDRAQLSGLDAPLLASDPQQPPRKRRLFCFYIQVASRPLIRGSGSQRKEVWASGDAYERYVGRWSRLAALQFLDWLAVPPGGSWLDVGCGTGMLTRTILQVADPRAVMGVDSAERFLDFAGKVTPDARATFQLGDAQDLPVETAAFDAVVSGLMLNFVPRPADWMKGGARRYTILDRCANSSTPPG